ncbi:MAG: FAD-dependent oxidoreductase [Patescibacteria group bacterium]
MRSFKTLLLRIVERVKNISLKKVLKIGLILALSLLALFLVCIAFVAIWVKNDPIPGKMAREQENTKNNIVNDVTEINPIKVVGIVVPHSIEDIQKAVRENDHVSIGGGRNSMGGQTASERAVQIDMREYTKILSLSTSTKEITVQAGIRWRDIQDFIDPHGLSVKIMQTYSNFTVGGSLSVNVHGRYIGLGPVILSVKSFRIVLADGSVVQASPDENRDIFYSAIGGMGGIGVISDVTLELAENVNVERSRVKLSTSEYYKYFTENIRDGGKILFHNGDMYPPDFEHISAVSWSITDKEPTTENRLIPRRQDYWFERIAWVVMSEWPQGRWIREYVIDPLLYGGEAPVHTRNYEASYDVAELEPQSRDSTTYVLQEYFVPVEKFDEWVPKMKKVFVDNDVNVINVSIRHAQADSGAVLAWARKESFAFVVYYKQGTDEESRKKVGEWTRQMIDQVLTVGGTYYLPYQLLATDDQIHRAYPHLVEYFEIKNAYDPTDKFTNKLWDTYYSKEKLEYYKKKQQELSVASTTKDYFRPFDNAYLSIPEWYIVYSADEYAAVLRDSLPSKFSYSTATRDFRNQHAAVLALTEHSLNNNSGYELVLKVIGASFAFENAFKGVYENTIGRFSEWVAGDMQIPEDVYAAKIAQEYADFIYDYPWYEFRFLPALTGLWSLDTGIDHTFSQSLRRIERKLFLSFEYSMKALYSSVIGFATHTKFGVQDDIVYAVVTRDGGQTTELISAPHYQPFTRLLRTELAAEVGNTSFSVLDISGNSRITFTYKDVTGAPLLPGLTEIIRDPQIIKIDQSGSAEYVDRITAEVSVGDLLSIYRELHMKGIVIDHFYDY